MIQRNTTTRHGRRRFTSALPSVQRAHKRRGSPPRPPELQARRAAPTAGRLVEHPSGYFVLLIIRSADGRAGGQS